MSRLDPDDGLPVRDGALGQRALEDGRELVVYPMLFTWRLCIGPIDGSGYDDAWCYESPSSALEALATWDGEGDDPPCGWHRHPRTGRRRPNGDPGQEYLNP